MPEILDVLTGSRSLSKAVNLLETPSQYITTNIFKKSGKEFALDEVVDVESYEGEISIAQFSMDNDTEPKPIKGTQSVVKTLRIPRTYETKNFTTQELKTMMRLGEIYNNDVASRNKAIADRVNRDLIKLKGRVSARREWMACQAIDTGKMEVTQKDMKLKYDFGLTSRMGTMTGDDLWTAEAADIVGQIETWKREVPGADTLILGKTASAAFRSNAKVMAILHNNNLLVGKLDLTKPLKDGTILIGYFAGLKVVEYVQQYVDAAGATKDMIRPNRAIVINSDGDFRTHIGPVWRIKDNKGSLVKFNGEFLLVPHINERKTRIGWELEQRSILVPWDRRAIKSVQVVA